MSKKKTVFNAYDLLNSPEMSAYLDQVEAEESERQKRRDAEMAARQRRSGSKPGHSVSDDELSADDLKRDNIRQTTDDISGRANDVWQALKSGGAQLIQGAGWLANEAGAHDSGQFLRDIGQIGEDQALANMTPDGREAQKNGVFKEDLSGVNDDWGRGMAQGIAGSAVPSIVGAVLGAPVARGIGAAGEALLGRAAVSEGALGSVLDAAIKYTPAPVMRLAGALPGAAGAGAGEAAVTGATNGAQAYQEVMDAPIESLRKSTVFQSLSKELGSEDAARKAIADRMSIQTAKDTALSTGLIGAAMGGGAVGSLLNKFAVKQGAKEVGRLGAKAAAKEVLKDGTKEFAEEFAQSGPEHYLQNAAKRDYLDPTIDPSTGMLRASLEGGVVGMGQGMGMSGGAHAVNRLLARNEPQPSQPANTPQQQPNTKPSSTPKSVAGYDPIAPNQQALLQRLGVETDPAADEAAASVASILGAGDPTAGLVASVMRGDAMKPVHDMAAVRAAQSVPFGSNEGGLYEPQWLPDAASGESSNGMRMPRSGFDSQEQLLANAGMDAQDMQRRADIASQVDAAWAQQQNPVQKARELESLAQESAVPVAIDRAEQSNQINQALANAAGDGVAVPNAMQLALQRAKAGGEAKLDGVVDVTPPASVESKAPNISKEAPNTSDQAPNISSEPALTMQQNERGQWMIKGDMAQHAQTIRDALPGTKLVVSQKSGQALVQMPADKNTGKQGKAIRKALDHLLLSGEQLAARDQQRADASERAKAANRQAQQIDPERDDIVNAVAKLGGIDTEQALSEWWRGQRETVGHYNAEVPGNLRRQGVFAFKRGGMAIDDMVRHLEGEGYLPHNATPNDLLDALENRSKHPAGYEADARAAFEAQAADLQQDETPSREFQQAYDDGRFADEFTKRELEEETDYLELNRQNREAAEDAAATAKAAELDALIDNAPVIPSRPGPVTEEELDAIFGQQSRNAAAEGTQTDREPAAGRSMEGAESGTATAEAAPEEDGFDLAGYTESDLRREEQAAEQQQREVERQRAAADKARQDEETRKEIRRRSEAAADTFTLGGNAEDNLTGQGGLFDAPAETIHKPISKSDGSGFATRDALRAAATRDGIPQSSLIEKRDEAGNWIGLRHEPDGAIDRIITDQSRAGKVIGTSVRDLHSDDVYTLLMAASSKKQINAIADYIGKYAPHAAADAVKSHLDSALKQKGWATEEALYGGGMFDAPAQEPAKPSRITEESAGNMRAGDVVRDGSGKEYLALGSRHKWLEVAPIVNGKAQISADTTFKFHLDPETADAYPERRADPVYATGENLNEHADSETESSSAQNTSDSTENTAETPQNAASEAETAAHSDPESKGEGVPFKPEWDRFVDFWNGLHDGKVTIAADVLSAFDSLSSADGESQFKQSLNAMKVDQLRRRLGWSARPDDKKADLISKLYRGTLDRLTLNKETPERIYSFGSDMGKVEAEYRRKLRDVVASLTDGDVREFADKSREADQERQKSRDAYAESLKNPQSLSDFQKIAEQAKNNGEKIESRLNEEQLARYDSLVSEDIRNRRNTESDQKREVKDVGAVIDSNIVETKHTKYGHDLFVVRMAERVDRDVYDRMNAAAKKLGGGYSAFRGNGAIPGFQFRSREAAEAFKELAGGNKEKAQQLSSDRRDAFADDKSQGTVDRLLEMAGRIEDAASASLNADRKTNTARRAAQAGYAEETARKQIAFAKTMRNIATGIENGRVTQLVSLRTKTQLETLQSLLRRSRDAWASKQIQDAGGSVYDQEKLRQKLDEEGDKPEIVAGAKFPSYEIHRSDVRNFAEKMAGIDGMKLLGARLLRGTENTGEYHAAVQNNPFKYALASSNGPAGMALFKYKGDAEKAIAAYAARKGVAISEAADMVQLPKAIDGAKYVAAMTATEAQQRGAWDGGSDARISLRPDAIEEAMAKVSAFNDGKPFGSQIHLPYYLDTVKTERQRLQAMGIENTPMLRAALRELISLKEDAPQADKVKQLERNLAGKKGIGVDYFPTPKSVAADMVSRADIQPGMDVLEPSAGNGNIADAIRDAGIDPDVVEMSGQLREILEAKGYPVVGHDFTELGADKKYDRIIMNPPFGGGADIDHVRHAFDMLKPGGRIVAIMGEGAFSRSDKKATEFRSWLDELGGASEQLPQGTFLDSSLPSTTGANARLVEISRPEQGETLHSKANDYTSTQGMSAKDLQSIIAKELPAHLRERVKVAQSRSNNTQQSAQSEDNDRTEAEYDLSTQQLTLYADAIPTPERALFVLSHELTHYGLDAKYGFGLSSILLEARNNPMIAKLAAAIAVDRGMAVNSVRQDIADARGVPVARVARSAAVHRLQVETANEALAELNAAIERNDFAYLQDRYGVAVPKMMRNDLRGRLSRLAASVKAWLAKLTGKQATDYSDKQVWDLLAGVRETVRGGGKLSAGYSDGAAQYSMAASSKTINVDGVTRPTTNNNNQPIAQTEEGLRNFWRWFGGSKVVDKDGKPLVVYHGTESDFDSFDQNKVKTTKLGSGFYFAKDPETANLYAGFSGSNVVPVYLRMERPLIASSVEEARQILEDNGQYMNIDEFSGTHAADMAAVLAKAGFDGIMYDGVMVVQNPTQIKSAIGNRGTFNGSDPNILRSTAPKQPASAGFVLPEETTAQQAQREVQDNMNRWKQVLENVREQGGQVDEQSDVYGAEERFHGRAATRIEDFARDEVEPLMERLADSGHTLQEVEQYLLAQHAEEANARIREIDDSRDTAFGMEDGEAQSILAKFAALPDAAEFKRLANDFRRISEGTLSLYVKAGIVAPDSAHAMRLAYQFYVPVKGGDEDQAARQGTGKGLSVNGKQKRRMGHDMRDEHVLENMLRDRQRAIVLAEKNNVGTYLLDLIERNPDPKLWTVNVLPKQKVLRDQVSYVVELNGQMLDAFNSMEAARVFIQAEAARTGSKPGAFAVSKSSDPYVTMMAKPTLQDHEVQVYVQGRAVRIQLHDPILAGQYRRMGTEQMGRIIEAGKSLNRWLSKVYTGYNPEFFVKNVVRDLFAGTINLTADQGGKVAAKALSHWPKAGAAMFRFALTGKAPAGEYGKALQRYRAAGGSTGAAYMGDLERQADTLQTLYENYSGAMAAMQEGKPVKAAKIATRKLLGGLAHWFEVWNQAGENAFRLATFMAMEDAGKTVAQSSSMAKNVTVNFNRKGELTPQLGGLYLFFNPGVQGTARLWQSMFGKDTKHKKLAWALVGAAAGAAFALALMNRWIDEDEWEAIPDSVKDRNLIIFLGGKRHITIPMPYGFSFFVSMANRLDSVMHGESAEKASIRLASSLFENFSPVGNPIGDDPKLENTLLLLPTALKILALPAANMTDFGGPMRPEYREDQPDNEKMWRGTRGSLYDKAAQAISGGAESIGIGSRYENDWADISPETIKYLVKTLTGGTGSFMADSASLLNVLASGSTPDVSEVPFVRSGMRESTVKDARARFHELGNEAKEHVAAWKRAVDAGDDKAATEYEQDGELMAMGEMLEGYRKQAKSLRDLMALEMQREDLTLAEKRMKQKAYENQEAEVYREYIRQFKH